MTSPAVGRVAAAALLTALGAVPGELDEAWEILQRHQVPDDMRELVTVAKDAIELVRMGPV